MREQDTAERIVLDLAALGVRPGATIMVHSSLRSLGLVEGGAETVVRGLLAAVGERGNLLMPALSYEQEPRHVHRTLETPSNVGAVPEHFRRRAGTVRSVHPTHSVCGVGPGVEALFRGHPLDSTPCGPGSPFSGMIGLGARIVMLGCGLGPNTTMHALEERAPPPYLFGEPRVYTITPPDGRTFCREYLTHGFDGWRQRYDRVAELPDATFLRRGRVLGAETFVLDAAALEAAVVSKLEEESLFFVERDAGEGT